MTRAVEWVSCIQPEYFIHGVRGLLYTLCRHSISSTLKGGTLGANIARKSVLLYTQCIVLQVWPKQFTSCE